MLIHEIVLFTYCNHHQLEGYHYHITAVEDQPTSSKHLAKEYKLHKEICASKLTNKSPRITCFVDFHARCDYVRGVAKIR